jgi:hypothetical protein
VTLDAYQAGDRLFVAHTRGPAPGKSAFPEARSRTKASPSAR